MARVTAAPNDGDSMAGVGAPADGGSKRNALAPPPPLLPPPPPRNADDGTIEAAADAVILLLTGVDEDEVSEGVTETAEEVAACTGDMNDANSADAPLPVPLPERGVAGSRNPATSPLDLLLLLSLVLLSTLVLLVWWSPAPLCAATGVVPLSGVEMDSEAVECDSGVAGTGVAEDNDEPCPCDECTAARNQAI